MNFTDDPYCGTQAVCSFIPMIPRFALVILVGLIFYIVVRIFFKDKTDERSEKHE